MKNFILLLMAVLLIYSLSAQEHRVQVPKSMQMKSIKKTPPIDETTNIQNTINHYVRYRIAPEETEIGNTVFDLQTNASSPSNRIELFSDGTIGATWTFGTVPPDYENRGTGYNFFDGTAWGSIPTARVESIRTGWPSYTSCGLSGEAFVSHSAEGGLNFNKRETKGSGTWESSTLSAPDSRNILWPRLTSSGTDNNILHVFALTAPIDSDGTLYEGLDGALLYYRSPDAGATWEEPVILPGLGAEDYYGFSGDGYSLNAKGDNIVLLYTENWTDMFIMKSTDNGQNWVKTTIWEHPIPRWNDVPSIDTIFCPDGAGHATFDTEGKVHVVFGLSRSLFAQDVQSWFPWVDGLAYWNEDLPTYTGGDQANILNPDSIFLSGNLIGYISDFNSNGALDIFDTSVQSLGDYSLSTTSMPQMVIDELNNMYVIYSSITETFDNEVQNYRHLWVNMSRDGGETWDGQTHLGDDSNHLFDEMVFPSVARFTSDNTVHLIYQADSEPGLSARGDEDEPTDNIIYHMQLLKDEVLSDDKLTFQSSVMQVSTAYPNPAKYSTSINISIPVRASVFIEVISISGQKVIDKSLGYYPAGTHKFDLDLKEMTPGLYFINVTSDGTSKTGKLTVLR